MKTKLFIIYGGKSVEHEVSLKTALTVIKSLDESKYEIYPIYIARDGRWSMPQEFNPQEADIQHLTAEPSGASVAESMGALLIHPLSLPGRKAVLPLLHGTNGEDGTVQGLLELLDLPYVGNGILSSALTLDKAMSKRLLAQSGFRQVEHLVFDLKEWEERPAAILNGIEQGLGLPCYVKPASLGSSIGISRCCDREQLQAGLREAFHYDTKIVVEKELLGREIQVAVMGNDDPLASLPGEFVHDNLFFDFESKYFDNKLTMSIPAELPGGVTQQIRELARQAYRLHGCSGLARVDFFLDEAGELYLNEINALPGFTNKSMYPVMWERTDGTTYAELVEKLIEYAFVRHEQKQTIRYSR
ncbi:D-alanine--D-alanine ligase [Paenibacillus pasadenensis]|uniref:D-alanine--D-alanine ligase family protein n=1 Tax=Paenibacillus pasadenensis TaxID=217090 RepID=UPI00203C93A0|nr:D-alanine--D-alanine ligase family protein [Paenibacillus pasadenensis]MCM3749225.1 D-alanine--D-alanine ligase [Paenibacillus pasadenensis]